MNTLMMLASAVFGQAAPPLPALSPEFSLPALSSSIRNVTKCPSGDTIVAEFEWIRGITTVAVIQGYGHKSSRTETSSINKRLTSFGGFSHISIGCSEPGKALIVAHGTERTTAKEIDLTILWTANGFKVLD